MARNHFILRNSREFLTSFYPNIIPRILENSQELGGGGGGGGGVVKINAEEFSIPRMILGNSREIPALF